MPGVTILVVLAAIAFAGGVVVAAGGPGGIFLVTALYALTALSNTEVAGTSSATFAAGAAIGSVAYAHSGEVDWTMAVVVGLASALGTRAGVLSNAHLSRRLFGVILAALLAVVGATIVYREGRDLEPAVRLRADSRAELAAFAGIGIAIGFFGGLLGIGGAALSVPALVFVGVPMLVATAVTQVVVGFITLFTTANYLALGAVDVPVALLTGSAYVVGIGAGWRVAHRIDPSRLKVALGIVLLALAPVIVFS